MREIVIVRLMLVAPLAALLLVSLGFVVLKRRSGLSPWMARLTTPPFYLVSLPIATLIAGAQMLGLYSLLVLHKLLSPVELSWRYIFEGFFNPLPFAYFLLLFTTELPFDIGYGILASFVGFCAAMAISGYLLWRTVWRERHPKLSSRIGSQRL